MSLIMGDSRKMIKMNIDLESNITRITQEHYKETGTRKEIQGDTIYYEENKIECIENEDIVHFESRIIPSFRFYITDIDVLLKGSHGSALAFAYSIPNHNHSLTHLLKEYGFIDESRFTLMKSDDSRGVITLGSITDLKYTSKHNLSCQVTGQDGNWDCNIDKIVTGNYTHYNKSDVFKNKYSSHFSSAIEYIKAPKEFYDYILRQSFKDFIESNKCSIDANKPSRLLRCNCEVFESIAQLSFVINNRNLTFDSNELFNKISTECVFVISQNRNINQWVIGNVLLKKYIVSFSYDDSNVVFYSDEPFLQFKDTNCKNNKSQDEIIKKHTQSIIISISIIILVCLFCLIYSKLKYLRRERTKPLNANDNDYQKINMPQDISLPSISS